MKIYGVSNLDHIKRFVDDLIRACEAEISEESRPADAFPIHKVIAIFLIHAEHAAAWPTLVAAEVWNRLGRYTDGCFAALATEDDIKRQVWALNHQEVRQFRAGTPLLKIVAPFKLRALKRGTRTNHPIEIAIREALQFETFRRDIEIAAIKQLATLRPKRKEIVVARGTGISELVARAWVEGVPAKGLAADQDLPVHDRAAELFSSLRAEGEKYAARWMPGAVAEDVVREIIKHVTDAPTEDFSEADFEASIANSARCVKTMMKACAQVTALTREKNAVGKKFAASNLPSNEQAEPVDLTHYLDEPMNPRQHGILSGGDFSPGDLAYVAMAADIDPNLLSPAHVLATPEFVLARKLGRLSRVGSIELPPIEVLDLWDILAGEPTCLYAEAHKFLTDLAFAIRPREVWETTLEDAAARRQTLCLQITPIIKAPV